MLCTQQWLNIAAGSPLGTPSSLDTAMLFTKSFNASKFAHVGSRVYSYLSMLQNHNALEATATQCFIWTPYIRTRALTGHTTQVSPSVEEAHLL